MLRRLPVDLTRAAAHLGRHDIAVFAQAVTEEQEKSICEELESVLRRRRYARDHWDQVIVGSGPVSQRLPKEILARV